MYAPLNFDKINLINGSYTPSQVKNLDNATFAFWERALFQRAISVLKITLPKDWNGDIKDFFNYCLFRLGYVAVFNHEKYGLIFQPCSLSGYDIFYRPTDCLVTSPALTETLNLKIGKDCGILKICPDYMGIWDIIAYYAEKLSLLDNAINISLINNKYAFMLVAKNKAAGEALKKMLDRINQGEPAVVADISLKNDPNDKTEPWQFWDRGNIKDSYMTTQQLSDFRTILNNFDNEIGIVTLPLEKKERMITSEAEGYENDTKSRVRVWVETFNESAIAVNKMFGTDIKAELKEERGIEDAEQTDIDGDV